MARIRCWFSGCQIDGEPGAPPECWRCGADLYDADYVQLPFRSRIVPFKVAYWWWKAYYFVHQKCNNCGKHLWMTDESFCSKKCLDEWIPF